MGKEPSFQETVPTMSGKNSSHKSLKTVISSEKPTAVFVTEWCRGPCVFRVQFIIQLSDIQTLILNFAPKHYCQAYDVHSPTTIQ